MSQQSKANLICHLCNFTLNKGLNDIEGHYLGAKHDKNRALIQSPNYQVYVWWRLPVEITMTDIVALFLNHGPVADVSLYSLSSCFVTSNEPHFITWLLANQPPIYHRGVLLSIWAVPAPFTPPKFPEQFLNPNQLEGSLVQFANLERQVDSFLRWAELPIDEQDFQTEALRVIRTGLANVFPRSKVTIIGSSSTGMQLPLSCLDLSVVLDSTIKEPTKKFPPTTKENLSQLKARMKTYFHMVKLGHKGKLDVGHLLGENKRSQLEVLERVVRRYVKGSEQLIVISAPKSMILKFNFRNQLPCRMKIDAQMDVQNSKLLWFMNQLDPRVRPLVLMVQHWARCHRLVYSSGSLSGYALTWLVVFFLQNIQPPVLPTVKFCQDKLAPYCTLKIIKGYNCSFCADIRKYPPSTNTLSVETLLRDFFNFYKDFDFVNNIICPFNGKLAPRIEFYYIPGSKFDSTFIQIQDPLEHKSNLGVSTKAHFYSRWLAELEHASKALQTTARPEWVQAPWGLAELFHPWAKEMTGRVNPGQREFRYDLGNYSLCSPSKLSGLDHKEKYLNAAAREIHRFLKEVLQAELITAPNHLGWPEASGGEYDDWDEEGDEEAAETGDVPENVNASRGIKRKHVGEENNSEPKAKKLTVKVEPAETISTSPKVVVAATAALPRKRPLMNKKKNLYLLQTIRVKTNHSLWINRPPKIKLEEDEEPKPLLEHEKEISEIMLDAGLPKKVSVFRLKLASEGSADSAILHLSALSRVSKDLEFERFMQEMLRLLLDKLQPMP